MKKIALVTVTYNTEKDTHALLKSIQEINQDGFSLDILVIDNGSKDIFSLDKAYDLNITIHRIENNIGFTGGYNTGMKEALSRGNDYILIMNNDVEVKKGLIKNLLTVLEQSKEIGVTVPKIYFAKGHEYHKSRYKKSELGRVLWFAGGKMDWNNVFSVHRGLDEIDQGQYDKIEETEFATGCCMMFKRDTLEEIGLFDERYFLYYEDADLSERIKRAGYKLFYVPTATLAHVNASSTGGAGNVLHDYFISRNKLLFGMTYAPLRTKFALVRESIRLLLQGRAYQKKGVRDFYLARFGKGTFPTKR